MICLSCFAHSTFFRTAYSHLFASFKCPLTKRFYRECAPREKNQKEKRKTDRPSLAGERVLSGADENWQRSFREGGQWARIVKTSLPNHGGREQRQSPALLRGRKLIRRGARGAPQVFAPRNAARRLSLGESRARTKGSDVISSRAEDSAELVRKAVRSTRSIGRSRFDRTLRSMSD